MYKTIAPPHIFYCTDIDRDPDAQLRAGRIIAAYPHSEVIEEIRKHNPDIPITLCTESAEMWQEFAPLIGQEPGTFVCGCGPMTIPGLRRLRANAWSGAKPVSTWTAQ